MTKALICVRCSDVLAPYAEPARNWRWCACGASAARWRDPAAGLLDVTSTLDENWVRVLGLANPFLATAVHGRPYGDEDAVNEEWRLLHDQVCEDTPANYLFSERRRHCWAIVIRPGETGDVRYVPYSSLLTSPAGSTDGAARS